MWHQQLELVAVAVWIGRRAIHWLPHMPFRCRLQQPAVSAAGVYSTAAGTVLLCSDVTGLHPHCPRRSLSPCVRAQLLSVRVISAQRVVVHHSNRPMAVSAEGAPSPASTHFHTAFPSTTLFHTHTHPIAPPALSCSSAHVVALLTPSFITFQPLSNLTPPASFPPSTASSLAVPLPPITAFPALTFPAPHHVSHPTVSDSSALAFQLSTSAVRTARVSQLDVDALPALPPPNHFLRGKWAEADTAGFSLYGVVMTRGNAHLLQVSSTSALAHVRSLYELSSLLMQQHQATGAAGDARAESVEEWLARLCSVAITAIAFSSAVPPNLNSQSSSSSAHSSSSLLVAVGTKDGRVSLLALPLPASSAAAVTQPALVGSFAASTEYITELSFAPAPTSLPSAAATPLTSHLTVGDSSGVTTVWVLSGGMSSVNATQLHTFMPDIPHAPVSILTWHRPPPPAAGRPRADDTVCDACDAVEQCGASHVLLATAVASSVCVHFFHLPSLVVCSSYSLPPVHNHHISSLSLTSSLACPLPVLLSSSASSACHRHLLTSTSATHHPHYHRPTLVSPLPSRYGLATTADGLLLLGCDVRMADNRSLKKRDGMYVTSVKAWPVDGLDGGGGKRAEVARVETSARKRKRRYGGLANARETDEQKAARWTQQHRLLDEFSAPCDVVIDASVPRCHFNLCLYITSRLSPLSHLLARAMSEPPPFNPHTSTAHIRFVDALVDWLEAQLLAVWGESLPWSEGQIRMRTLHFLAMFALRCTSGDCQFVELTDDEKTRVLQCREQLEAALATRHFSARLASASPATASRITAALTLLTPLLSPALPALPPHSTGSSTGAAVVERCFVCDAVLPFESWRWAECTNGHRWCRDADTLCVMSAVAFVECAQCEGRAEWHEAGSSSAADTAARCWMCDVVRVRVDV